MSFANTRVVRRSSALYDADQKSYGTDFIFKELGSYPSKRSARMASFGLIFAFLVISTPLRHIVRKFLPKPGEGPNKETREMVGSKDYLRSKLRTEKLNIFKFTEKEIQVTGQQHKWFVSRYNFGSLRNLILVEF